MGELLVSVRLTLDAQNRSSALSKMTFNERLLMLAAVDRRVKATLKSAAENVSGYEKMPAPKTLKAFEDRLRLFDATRQKLTAAQLWAKYGVGLASKIVGRRRSRLKPVDREIVEASSAKRVQQIRKTEREIEELQMGIRLARLKFGVEVLKNSQLTKERFRAVYSTGLDAQVLLKFLTPQSKPTVAQKPHGKGDAVQQQSAEQANEVKAVSFSRAALNRPRLAEKVTQLQAQAKELAGELTVKAGMFFEGLGWWLRGRFGWGPDVGGLAKSAAPLKDPQMLLAVGMPFELPTVISPSNSGRVRPTHMDRRHHYTWVWEDRKLVRTAKDSEWEHTKKARIAGYVPAIHRWSRERRVCQHLSPRRGWACE